MRKELAILVSVLAGTVATATAQPNGTVTEPVPEAPPPPPERQPLSTQVVDPTAPLMEFTGEFQWLPSYHEIDGRGTAVLFRGTVPFRAFGAQNILSLDVPYQFDAPGDQRGLAPTELTDIVVLERRFGGLEGNLALGATASFFPGGMTFAGDSVNARFEIGPTIGAVGQFGPWLFGVMTNTLFGSETAFTSVQPVLAYGVLDWLSFSLSESSQIVFDWNDVGVATFPLGVQANAVIRAGEQPIRLFVAPTYNIDDDRGNVKWQLVFGAGVVVPQVR